MTTASEKEPSIPVDQPSISLQPSPTTLTSNAADTKEEDLELYYSDHAFNSQSDNDDTLTTLYWELSQLDEKESKAKDKDGR